MTIFFKNRPKTEFRKKPENYDQEFEKAVRKGMKSAREGRLIPHEEIEKEWFEEKKRLLDRKGKNR